MQYFTDYNYIILYVNVYFLRLCVLCRGGFTCRLVNGEMTIPDSPGLGIEINVSFSDAPVGPGYEVLLPYDFEAAGLEAEQRKEGRVIFYDQTLSKPMNIRVPMPRGYAGPNTVTVRHPASGQEITATTSLPGTCTFLHASPDYLCPEQFVRISLTPGEFTEWTNGYKLSHTPVAAGE